MIQLVLVICYELFHEPEHIVTFLLRNFLENSSGTVISVVCVACVMFAV